MYGPCTIQTSYGIDNIYSTVRALTTVRRDLSPMLCVSYSVQVSVFWIALTVSMVEGITPLLETGDLGTGGDSPEDFCLPIGGSRRCGLKFRVVLNGESLGVNIIPAQSPFIMPVVL